MRASKSALACTGWACNENGNTLAHIVACGEVLHLLLVDSSLAVINDFVQLANSLLFNIPYRETLLSI